MSQPRAHSALRHELDAIVAELKPIIEKCRVEQPERSFDLHVLPFRVIVRADDAAVSFSWVTGRMATVADGCLLVIAWRNVTSAVRGVAALNAAAPTNERTYFAYGASADTWRWRADGSTDEPASSAELVAEWIASAGIAESSRVR